MRGAVCLAFRICLSRLLRTERQQERTSDSRFRTCPRPPPGSELLEILCQSIFFFQTQHEIFLKRFVQKLFVKLKALCVIRAEDIMYQWRFKELADRTPNAFPILWTDCGLEWRAPQTFSWHIKTCYLRPLHHKAKPH